MKSSKVWIFKKSIDKNISALKFHEIKLKLTSGDGENNKPALINAQGHFYMQVSKPGIYKIELFNSRFYFEPVLVQILSEEE